MDWHFRGSQEWRDHGMVMTTGSDEACKMFDASLLQTFGWCNIESLGGMAGTFNKMKQADPDFVMGYVLGNWMDTVSSKRVVNSNDGLSEDIARMVALSKSTPGITERELKHVQAVELCAQGYRGRALEIWEDILLEYPLDACAIYMSHSGYISKGESFHIRDCLARVLPHWKPTMPLYGYLLGLYSFGLEESNMFSEAEKVAQQALSINPRDAWATHSLCHSWEMMGKQKELLQMMEKTQSDWNGGGLACHNYWHWALNHIQLGDYESAVSIFDDQLNPRLSNNGSMFNFTDIVSLLYRLEMEGAPVGDRWDKVSTMYQDHMDDHVSAFNDVHVFMSCLKSKDEGLADKMMESIQDFIREGKGDARDVMADVGESVVKAFAAYKERDYGSAVDLLYPVKNKIKDVGGSNAQRDVFSLFLIHVSMKSPRKKHQQLARNLLNERKALIPHAPMTDRLMAKILEAHDD